MKTRDQILLMLSILSTIPASHASGINGVAIRFSSEKTQIIGVKTHQTDPLSQRRIPTEVSHIDYQLVSGAVEIFVREGDAEITDPEAPEISVETVQDQDVGEFHVTGIICGSPTGFTCGIRIGQKAPERPSLVETARIYISIRGRSRVEIARVIKDQILEAAVRVGDMTEFRRIKETGIKDSLEQLVKQLETPSSKAPLAH